MMIRFILALLIVTISMWAGSLEVGVTSILLCIVLAVLVLFITVADDNPPRSEEEGE